VGYDLQANEISEDSYKISWKVSTEVFFWSLIKCYVCVGIGVYSLLYLSESNKQLKSIKHNISCILQSCDYSGCTVLYVVYPPASVGICKLH
jgi:hypothetical protein